MLDEIIQRTFLVGKSYITGTNPNSKVSFPTSVKEKELSSLNLNNPPLLQKSAEVAICSNQIQLGGGGGGGEGGRGGGGRGKGDLGGRVLVGLPSADICFVVYSPSVLRLSCPLKYKYPCDSRSTRYS